MGNVVGRYAPSPTGDLHLGNLRTALLAWLHARLQGGSFLLRMEDLDTPRVVKGSDTNILRDLEWLGIDWDGSVVYQSTRQSYYEAAMQDLRNAELLYPCFCSRKEIREIASAPHTKISVYPGLCSTLSSDQIAEKAKLKEPAIRVRVNHASVSFNDGLLGEYSQSLDTDVGDFVVKRADGLFAYQLAVVVDDLEQQVTHIVRGADLIDSTPRQLYLIQCLDQNASLPDYLHLPLVTNKEGERLAKRDGSASVSEWKSRGLTQQQMVAQFANELNLIDKPTSLSAEELITELSLESLQTALISASQTASTGQS